MNDTASLLGKVDGFCSQLALALQTSELQIYATLAVILLLSFLLFPPMDDLDQI